MNSVMVKFGVITLLILGMICLSLGIGKMQISLWDMGRWSEVESMVLWSLRWPRTATALVIGACLGAAGATFQGLLRNPLADPYILGVSAGAGIGAAVAIVSGLSSWHTLAIPLCAIFGAFSSMALVLLIVRQLHTGAITHYILAGVMVNAFLSAGMMLMLYVAKSDVGNIMAWLMGDLSRLDLRQLTVLAIGFSLGLSGLLWGARRLDIMSLGDTEAKTLSVDVGKSRLQFFLLSSFLTGLAVANAGMIGFIGLIVPHAVRRLMGGLHRPLILFSAIFGALFLLAADMLSRILPWSLPIGLMTALVGVPIFLVIMIKTVRLS